MFDQIVGEKTARKPLAVAVSFSGQMTLLGLALLFPLLQTHAITVTRLTHFVPLKPWGPHPEVTKPTVGHGPARPGPRIFTDHVFREPSRIPDRVAMLTDAPTEAVLPGLSAFNGPPDGVVGFLPTEVAPPPKPAPPKPIVDRPAAVPPRLKVGGMVQAAKILRQVKPVYPPLARQSRISGEVRLEAVISRDGTIESLRVMSGHPLLVPAAIEAVRQWVYQPTLLNGDPVEVLTQIEVHFKLGE